MGLGQNSLISSHKWLSLHVEKQTSGIYGAAYFQLLVENSLICINFKMR